MARNEKPTARLLTDTELELMTILWMLGEGSVSDVLQMLPKGRNLAYTSVSTILRILEQKEFVSTRKEGRGHVYIPRIKKEQYEATSLQHLLAKVFEGNPGALVSRLIESKALNRSALDEIREILDR
jgi:predicted transcriptional regulator